MIRTITNILEINPYKLTLAFDHNDVVIVDLESTLKDKSHTKDSIFKALLDPAYFQQVKLDQEYGFIYWDNGVDFCPDVLYNMGEAVKTINK